MRRGTPIFRSIESFYSMLGRGAQKRRRENFSTFAGKKKSPSPPASRFITKMKNSKGRLQSGLGAKDKTCFFYAKLFGRRYISNDFQFP